MTKIYVHIFLLFIFSYLSLACCEVHQLKIEQNKNVFCPGETATLTCRWENVPASFWKVNGTLTSTGGINGIAGHSTSTSLTEGFARVSITQTQPSVTSYTCIASVDEDFPSEVVSVTFRGTQCLEFTIFVCAIIKSFFLSDSQLELFISHKRKETSLLVSLNVTNKGCPPLEQVRITVNNAFLIGRRNDTFGFEGLTPDVEYLLQVETQVEGEDFGLYKNMTVPVYNTSDGTYVVLLNVLWKFCEWYFGFYYTGLDIQEVDINSDQCKE